MPHFDYIYHAGGPGVAGAPGIANCAPLLAGVVAAPGNPAPNLVGLAGTAGGALPGVAAFPGAGLGAIPGVANRVPYSWAALTAAAVVIGLYPPGAHPLYEAAWRVANLRMASYTHGGVARLRRTPLLGNLETSERRYLSYFMGMSLSVYTARVCGFTFPMHFSRFSAVNGGVGVAYVQNAAFGAFDLPDIVFTNPPNGTCQIWEAKGRVGAAAAGGFAAGGAPAVLNAGMGQSRKIATLLVNGGQVVPNARISSVARLDPNTYWCLDVADPPDGPDRPQEERNMSATEHFYREFYRPYVEMVRDSQSTVSFGGRTYVVAYVPGTSTVVGLDERIERIFAASSAKRSRSSSGVPRTPDGIVNAIEGYLAEGYPQDPNDPDRFVSAEGIFTQAVEEDAVEEDNEEPPGQ